MRMLASENAPVFFCVLVRTGPAQTLAHAHERAHT
jgi:hypothetical protein